MIQWNQTSYQFIFSNETRSQANEDYLKGAVWVDHLIPEGSVIRHVILMYNREDAQLFGLKFLDSNGESLLAVGMIDDNDVYDYQEIGIKEIKIE